MSHRPPVGSSTDPLEAALTTRLDSWVERQGEKALYRFLDSAGEEAQVLTYASLRNQARALAARLLTVAEPGDRALLLFPPGLDFIVSFVACLYAGVVAVPAYPPGSRRTLPRVRSIAADARPRLVLTDGAHLEKLEILAGRAPELEGVRWMAPDGVENGDGDGDGDEEALPRLAASDVAFLQYTSGSTAAPKGVMVTHGNLVHNEEAIRCSFGLSEESVIVGWLPLYHDMGLIGNVLQPLYVGGSCVLMSPVAFLRSPVRWLQAVSRYRGTTSGAPNFAYELCVRRISEEDRRSLDLSTWTLAYNGAEPVRADSLERFARAFAPCGFRPEALYPCYGLAEATLLVTGGDREREPVVVTAEVDGLEQGRVSPLEEVSEDASAEAGRRLVGCGHAWLDQQVVIADPETRRRLPDGEVGEIWVSGPSVAAGYWQRQELTEEVFQARLADDPEAGTFLRTGDLGTLVDGELLVTGRLKDLIILRGRNHYPQDLELTAERAHPDLRPGCAAAFAVEVDGEEQLVLVQELERRAGKDYQQIFDAVRGALAREHEVTPWDLVLLKWGTVPKTSSGKIQRQPCRRAYLEGGLKEVARGTLTVAPVTREQEGLDGEALRELEAEARRQALGDMLRRRLAQQLRVAPSELSPDRPLVALGLDSLAAVELQHEIEQEIGVLVPMARLLEDLNLASLVELLAENLDSAAGTGEAGEEEALADTPGGLRRRRLEAAAETAEEPATWPLSEGQRALWAIQRTHPQSAAYLLRAAARIDEEVDSGALREAFAGLVGRHEVLRTVFPSRSGEPYATAVPVAGALDFRVEEARGRGEDELLEEMDREARRPMDAEAGPLVRIVLYRCGPAEHRLLMVFHHLVADFWSAALMIEELGYRYRRALGEDVPLPAGPVVRYRDYVAWQREHLEGGRLEQLMDHWSEALPRPLPVLDIHPDRSRPAVLSDAGGRVGGALDAELAERLEALARETGTTLFVVLLALWSILLHRLSGHPKILVGTPTAGRDTPDLSDVLGYFVNPVVLAADFGGRPTFRQLLLRLRRTTLDAFAHGELPFARLAERLQPTRDPSRSPVFQALFTLQQSHRPELAPLAPFVLGVENARLPLGPLQLHHLELPEQPAQMDLSLVAARTSEGIGLSLVYSRDLFDEATADHLVRRLVTLADAVAEAPWTSVGRLPLLAEPQRQQLLVEWNRTDTEFPEPALIHRLFEDSVDRFGASPALVFGQGFGQSGSAEEALSYAEVEARANRLAHHLLALGVAIETPVAVLLRRGPQIPTALLAVLKARGCYVPLDPSYPAERIAYMLEDSGASLVITEEELLPSLAGFAGRVVALDRDEDVIDGRSQARPHTNHTGPALCGHHLAYTIYTSGSTGRPKGVQVPHRGLVSFLVSMARRPGLGRHDVLASVTTLSFDIFALELFLPLALGAQVVLVSREAAGSGKSLLAVLEDTGATAMQATPTTWRLLLEAGWRGSPALKVLCGGEPLPLDLAQQLARFATSAWNLYGPTETTVWSAVHRLGLDASHVPLGRPIANTRIVLLDRHLEPVPLGVPGQIFIGGVGVARGYWGRPGLTAERFLPDGTGGEDEGVQPGSRLYATGDLGRIGRGGLLEFLGRLDHQVKVRGHRIELGEIETALTAHPAVEQAVVSTWSSRGGDDRLVAYLVVEEEHRQDPELALPQVRRFLGGSLPEAFLPSAVVLLDRFPLTPNGKVDRKALPEPVVESGDKGAGAVPLSGLERKVAEIWQDVLEVEAVGLDENFFDLGGHSLSLARVHDRLVELTGRDLPMVELFRHTTVRSLARLLGEAPASAGRAAASSSPESRTAGGSVVVPGAVPVAVIGVAGRFPGAADPGELWRRVAAGEELLTHFTDEELLAAGVDAELLERPDYVKVAGRMEGADLFDAEFFGFHPREAELMDPQHRVFLEVCWQALEDAGYDPRRTGGRVGVFASAGVHTYIHQAGAVDNASSAARYQIFIGNDKDFVPTRVAYKLGLEGPALNVQTACSSSLVAVHLACRSLAAGECEMALAGGVTIRTPLTEGYLWEEGGIPSPDGHCRAFDAEAQGTVFGSGAGVVALKPLDRALADGDTIHAVVRGTAINNDGAAKIGYTAPSIEGQAQVVAQALATAGVEASSIGYVEAHGTGTALGDPIEVAALAEAFRAGGTPPERCAIGSVKTNLGHLDTAAGVTGLIKAVASLEHRELAPSLHFQQPNPKLSLDATPFFVPTERTPWEISEGARRRAGVSSFGIGGTNAHAVLEEAPPLPATSEPAPWQLLVVSARGDQALTAAAGNLAEALNPEASTSEQDAAPALADAAYTLSMGRRPFLHRTLVVARDAADAAAALRGEEAEPLRRAVAPEEAPPVAFLFPGQGSQHLDMARDLAQEEPRFRAELETCCGLLQPLLGFDLLDLLLPEEPLEGEVREAAAARLTDTAVAQPALFAVEWSLAQLWKSWGVEPVALLGHSIGEYVAATLAGVFCLEEALAVVAARGRLMASLPAGSMAAVDGTPEEVAAVLAELGREDLEIAAVNGPKDVAVSGPDEAVAALLEHLDAGSEEDGPLRARRLHTSHAFHSAMMEPILDAFRGELEACSLSPPALPVISNRTGAPLTADQAVDPSYWADHLRHAVRFADGVETLVSGRVAGLDGEAPWLLEVGPGQALATLARKSAEPSKVLSSLPHPKVSRPAPAVLLETLGRLWLAGVEVDWRGFWDGQRRRRVPLPTYPFQRRRFWLDARKVQAVAEEDLQRRDDPSRWLSVPAWNQEPPLPAGNACPEGRWLVFAPAEELDGGLGHETARALDRALCAESVVRVVPGEAYERQGSLFRIDPDDPEHYQRLFADLAAEFADEGGVPERILHTWAATPVPDLGDEELKEAHLEESRTAAFFSLLWIARGLEISGAGGDVTLTVVSSGLHRITGGETLVPQRALLLGPVEVLPQEHPGLRIEAVDLDPREVAAVAGGDRTAVYDLLALLTVPRPGAIRALRAGEVWRRSFRELPLPPLGRPQAEGSSKGSPEGAAEELPVRLREGGVYLITGGLGGLGLEVARELVRRGRVRLVLLGRREVPPREQWPALLAAGGPVAAAVEALQELEDGGSEVLAFSADVTDEGALSAAVAQAEERFGPLHGVFHCAGVAGGGIALLKNVDEARRVLAPKVEGTLALDRVLGSSPLDFCLLFASVNGILGGFGQSDYAAANAFLDAFARSRYRRRGTYWAAIDWDRWEKVGMAARSASPLSLAGAQSGSQSGAQLGGGSADPQHPLLGVAVLETRERVVFVQEMAPASRWELAEHRIAGHPTLPGTTYLEMARAAFQRVRKSEDSAGEQPVEITDVAFLAPLSVADEAVRQVMLVLEAAEDGRWSFRVASSEPGAPLPGMAGSTNSGSTGAGSWLEHARGTVGDAPAEAVTSPTHDLEALRQRCSVRRITTEEGEARRAAADFLVTGTRWQSLQGLELGDGEGLALLDLPAEV
ncbi:MAG: amino acid adenylation domain-containing protein, partial [Acidobacteriota bacterium]|nr:amino acid adenylation domain-containing protein [Acidobacteriota bacterium]